jgi:hypothetical protein
MSDSSMIITVDVVEADVKLPKTTEREYVWVKFVGVGQPGIVLFDHIVCETRTVRKIREVLVAIDHTVTGEYPSEVLAALVRGKRVRIEVDISSYNHMTRFNVRRWLPVPPEPGTQVKQRRYRGQCEFGHVFTGELFGPTTPTNVEMLCPLDVIMGCGTMEWHAYDDEEETDAGS